MLLMGLFPPWRDRGYGVIFSSGGESLDFARLLVQWTVVVCFVVWRVLSVPSSDAEPYQPSLVAIWWAKLKHFVTVPYRELPVPARILRALLTTLVLVIAVVLLLSEAHLRDLSTRR
jgi:hypothetical protein